MSYKIRIPSKTTTVDETQLLTGIERLLVALEEHRRAVFVGGGVLLLAVIVVAGVFWVDYQTNQKARSLDQEATRHYLTRPADKPEQADKNLKEAIALYRRVVEQYPRSASGPIALYHLGNALVQANDLDAAIEAYKRFVVLYGSNSRLLGLVHQRLAYAYLLKGDRDQAAKALTSITEVPGTLNKDQALFELGKLEEAQARPEGALAHYQDLIKNYPNSPFAGEAAVRVKVLDVKKGAEGSAAALPDSQGSTTGADKLPARQTQPAPDDKKP